jgi:hypothetical protein
VDLTILLLIFLSYDDHEAERQYLVVEANGIVSLLDRLLLRGCVRQLPRALFCVQPIGNNERNNNCVISSSTFYYSLISQRKHPLLEHIRNTTEECDKWRANTPPPIIRVTATIHH